MLEGRRKQNWNVDEASAWGQSTKRFEIMVAEEGGAGGADVAVAMGRGVVREGVLFMK